jgi:hypothetical protein
MSDKVVYDLSSGMTIYYWCVHKFIGVIVVVADASSDLLARIGLDKFEPSEFAWDELPDCSLNTEFGADSRLIPLMDSAVEFLPLHIKSIEPSQFLSSLHLVPGPPLKMVCVLLKVF